MIKKLLGVICLSAALLAASVISADEKAPKVVPVEAEVLYSPNTSVLYANRDIKRQSEDVRHYVRYLSLYNVPHARRDDVKKSITFVVNSLSRRRKIYPVSFVPNSDKTVVRIILDEYDIPAKAWDNLGLKGSGPKPSPEPYFNVPVVKVAPVVEEKEQEVEKKVFVGHDYRGQAVYRIEKVKEKVKAEVNDKNKNKVEQAAAPWLNKAAITELAVLTKTQFPIFRADWFIANATLPPAYYEFLVLGDNVKDFEKLVFADEKLAEKARSQTKGIVISSIVARNNRTLTRSPTFTGGYYWISHDTLNSVDDRDYIRTILDEKFDATEIIATLPNKLQAYFLTDGAGKRQDAAPSDIAIDNTAIDRTVRTGRSCMICHNVGILPIDDEVRRLTEKLTDKDKVSLFVTKRDDVFRLQDLFGSKIEQEIEADQNLYTNAVKEATGLTTEKNAALYAEIYDKYVESLLTIEDVAREVAISPDSLAKYISFSNDPHILGLTKVPIRPLRRDQWEKSFADFMLIITSKVFP